MEEKTRIQTLIEDALKELESPKPKAAPLLEALQVAWNYLLTSSHGADRNILERINDAITKPQEPQKLKSTLEAILPYLSKPQKYVMKCIYCGCTEDHACEGGRSWAAKNVCSKCAAKHVLVIKNAHGQGVLLLKTTHQEMFVPLEAMVITADNLLNTYQEITGEKIWLKPNADLKEAGGN